LLYLNYPHRERRHISEENETTNSFSFFDKKIKNKKETEK